MNPADVQAILAQHDSPSPSVEGLQRLADWGTAFQKIIACGMDDNTDATAILTQPECLAIIHYVQLLGG